MNDPAAQDNAQQPLTPEEPLQSRAFIERLVQENKQLFEENKQLIKEYLKSLGPEELERFIEQHCNHIDAMNRPSRAVIARQKIFMFGLPILIGIGVYIFTSSILFVILALVVALITTFLIVLRLRPTPVALDFRTRAGEAYQDAKFLLAAIAGTREKLRTTFDPERRAPLEREIAFYLEQLYENLAIIAANDRSPGKGYIQFKSYTDP